MALAKEVDVLVIGAGVGGLCAAALMAQRGHRTLLVERLDRVGGRASTHVVDGFAVNTGALGIELGTETERVFNAVGATLTLREPSPGIVVRIGKRDVNISSGFNGVLVRTATRLLRWALKGLPALRPAPQESTQQWVRRFTRSAMVQGVVHNFVGSIFAAAPSDLPPSLFLHYVTTRGAFKRYGFPVGGTAQVWSTLMQAFEGRGGELWLHAAAQRLTFSHEGLASGAVLQRAGDTIEVRARYVISDVGPAATVGLCDLGVLPAAYLRAVERADRPAAIITVYFASREPLARFPGFACFSRTRRLCYATHFTAECPENAPPGWFLYCAASVPQQATGDFDEAVETALLMDDLREQFPGFDAARVVEVAVTRGEWPAQRAIAGSDLPQTTPVANLWLVGDGVKPWGNAATSACAETALIAARHVDEAEAARRKGASRPVAAALTPQGASSWP